MKRILTLALFTLTLAGCITSRITDRQAARSYRKTAAKYGWSSEWTKTPAPKAVPCKAAPIVLQGGGRLDPCAITTPLGQIRGGVFTLTERDFPWYLRWLFWFGRN